MTTILNQAINKIEAAAKLLETEAEGFLKGTVEPALEAEWTVLKPQILALGETVLGQVWQAAVVYVTSGGSAAAAVASVSAQLPADLVALEHLVMAAFAGAVQSIQAKQSAGQAA